MDNGVTMNFAAGFALSAMLVGMSWPAQACTTFWTEYQGRSFVGKNYDWDQESALLLFNKVGQKKQSLSFNPGNKPTEWTSKYASLTFNQYGREMPNGGMNMAGLVVEIMWFNRTRYPRVDERPSINELQWVQYQLDNFSSTQEVIQHAGKLRVAPIYAKVHYLVCDKIGHCAAFEYLNHKLVISPHAKALTNSSYARSAAYFKQVGLGEMKGASTSSLNRFANARRGSRAKKSSP
jgi:choloylglycine hydrolase